MPLNNFAENETQLKFKSEPKFLMLGTLRNDATKWMEMEMKCCFRFHPEACCKKGALTSFTKFIGKHLCLI